MNRLIVLLLCLFPLGLDAQTTAGSIAGTVLDAEGKPVVGVRVQAQRETYDSSGKRGLTGFGASVLTRAEGRYMLPALPPGKYFVQVFSLLVTSASAAFAPVFYPGVSDRQKAVAVEVTGGTDRTADIRMERQELFHIRGKIVNEVNSTSPVTIFYLLPAGGVSSDARLMINNAPEVSQFDLEAVLAGSYDLFATMTFNGGRYFGLTRLTVAGNTNTEIVMGGGAPLRGKVTVANNDRIDLRGLRISLRGNALPALMQTPPAAVGGDGTFTIDHLLPQDYELLAPTGLPGNAYVEKAETGGKDAMNSWITMGSQPSALDITVNTHGGEVSGTIFGPDQIILSGNVRAMLIPVRRTGTVGLGSAFRTVPTAVDGAFRLAGIPPGEYRLLGIEEGAGGSNPFFDPEFMKAHTGLGTLVKVAPDSRVTANGPLIQP